MKTINMKRIFKKIVLASMVLLFAFTAKGQQVGLSLTPQGTMPYTAGNSFQVFATYNYSNCSGNIIVKLTYNPAVLTFCGSTSCPYPYTNSPVGTITYTLPAATGNN